jgi:hypothetical protein
MQSQQDRMETNQIYRFSVPFVDVPADRMVTILVTPGSRETTFHRDEKSKNGLNCVARLP